LQTTNPGLLSKFEKEAHPSIILLGMQSPIEILIIETDEQ
jgi:hypothetical protein